MFGPERGTFATRSVLFKPIF